MNRQSVHIKLSTLSGIALAGLLTISAGCHKQVAAVHPPMAPQPVTAQAAPPPAPQRAATVSVVESKPSIPDTATKATIQSLLDRIQDVYFDYNKHAIRPDAERTLDADAKTLREILQDYPTYKLTIEGFCDERGSDEYNLALGDSRARKAEDFLTNLGLPSSQLRTVSFGKEKPVCTEHTEACWQKNRRAHITQEQPS
jgi:peptidoglycan-associated lipoprotein